LYILKQRQASIAHLKDKFQDGCVRLVYIQADLDNYSLEHK